MSGAFDHLEWTTKGGSAKSTNRLDDVIKLTESGKRQAEEVRDGEGRRNRTVWRWVHFCPGDGQCRREYGGIGQCLPTCAERDKKSSLSMHRCSLRVVTTIKLTDLLTDNPVNIEIQGSHIPATAQIANAPITSRIALSRETRQTARGVKRVMLAKVNGAQRDVLLPALENVHYNVKEKNIRRYLQRDDHRLADDSGPWTVVRSLLSGILKEKNHVLSLQWLLTIVEAAQHLQDLLSATRRTI